VSGTAVGVLISVEKDTSALLLIPFGLFGALVTTGLLLYERRQIKFCEHLICAGKEIEHGLGIKHGRFLELPKDRRDDGARLRALFPYKLVSVPTAGCFVYGASLGGWVFVFVLGLVRA
jgi:hypothetical protein